MQNQSIVYQEGDVLPDEEVVHRIGGSANLAIKPHEAVLDPPGISVLIGGTPEEAAAEMRRVFGRRSTLGRQASVVGTVGVGQLRLVGFDVIPKPSRNLPTHGRLIHPTQGSAGFTPDNLDEIAKVMQDKGGL
jgi:hypothetical protein